LHIARSNLVGHARIALTFDACMGQSDERILSTLVRERIPSTIFVTARWLKRNPAALAVFLQNPDLTDGGKIILGGRPPEPVWRRNAGR
ncbi:polysaccharide deacetylase family protein, partial [Rhizobium ruizarguesonis]